MECHSLLMINVENFASHGIIRLSTSGFCALNSQNNYIPFEKVVNVNIGIITRVILRKYIPN